MEGTGKVQKMSSKQGILARAPWRAHSVADVSYMLVVGSEEYLRSRRVV